MYQFRLAVASRCFNQSFLASLKSAADLGVTGLQIDIRDEIRFGELTQTGRRDLLHQVREHGLTIASAVFPLNYPLYEPDKIDVRVAAIRDAMKLAYSLQATTLCIRVGRIPDADDSIEKKLLVEALCDLSRYANHVGTVLAITPTNDSAETMKALLEQVKTGPIGVDFDPAHFVMTGRPISESLRLLHNLLLHVQLRDGIHGIEGGQEESVGQGNVDWAELLALLGETDYRGWLTLIRSRGNDQVRDIKSGLKFIQQLLLGG